MRGKALGSCLGRDHVNVKNLLCRKESWAQQASTTYLDELEQDVRIVTSCDPNAFICSSSERVNALVKMIFSVGLNWG